LFAKPHASLNAYNKLRHMFRKSLSHDLTQPVVFSVAQIPNPAIVLGSLPHQPGWVGLHLSISKAFAVAKRDEGAVSITSRVRLAVSSEPFFDFFRLDIFR
jgi:hypothetical protein